MGSKSKNKKSSKTAAVDSTAVTTTVTGGGSINSNNNINKKDEKNNITDDPRFARVHYDPRFQKVPKRTSKVSIDSRFTEIFTDKKFATSSSKVDKRGKPRKETENALRRYYHLDDDEIEGEGSVKEKKDKKKKKIEVEVEVEVEVEESGEESESESESESSGDEVEVGEVDEELGSTSESGSDSDSDDEDEEEDDQVENVPVIEKETHRLAVVNMEWNHVKAVDLFMMLRSFLPKGGQIKSVAVYPSEFGLKRMEEEAVRGPVALLDDEKKKKDVDDEDQEDDDDDDDIDTAKLRAYEISKLRYYYAVVECDTVATADYLYKACDGVEFERTSNVLDLRFIPDSMEFPHPPRDVAKEAPSDYEGLDFHTKALQHSNVTLSWDDDEPHRVKTLRRKFNENQLAELELKEFLASDESDSDGDNDGESDSDSNEDGDEGEEEDQNPPDNEIKERKTTKKTKNAKMAKKDMYRALIQSGEGSGEDEDEGHDMEVTFNTGLEDISKKILEKKDKDSETVWEAYLRKKREKKKARKYNSKNSSDDESDDSDQEPLEQPDDFFEDEPSAVRSKKASQGKKKRVEKASLEDEGAATREELELLLADEKGADNNIKGYKIKQKKGKGKKGKEAPDDDKLPTVDYDDPRFAALFTNPGFALDPTDPQFKRSATYFRQLAKRQENDREEHPPTEPVELSRPSSNDSVRKDENSVDISQKEKFELSSIVKSIKLKSQQLPKPSSVQVNNNKMDNGSSRKEKKHKLEGLDDKSKKKAKV